MAERIIINPVTRISGFLEINAEVEENTIVNAQSSGLLFRGFEKMLKGRWPLDAIYFTERICGICSTAHSMASTLALEDALKVTPDSNDKMLRDIVHGAEFLQNHIRHFYLYSIPDFVKGLNIEPLYPVSHNDYRIPENISLKVNKNYMDAVKFSRMSHELLAVLGGKAPHNHGIFVGGITTDINASIISKVRALLSDIRQFIDNEMVEDGYIIARYYSDYYNMGTGYGNLMTYGLYGGYDEKELFYVKPKVLIQGNSIPFDSSMISENLYRAWYASDRLEEAPFDALPEENLRKEGAYTWVKAPRYNGYPMEVGPLARMWLSGNYNRGISAMDRIIARVLETQKIAHIISSLAERVEIRMTSQKKYDIPGTAVGKGLTDTTRGALGHWLSIRDKVINHYDIITPSSWNLSPEDSRGVKGVCERALMGTKIHNPSSPAEIGRIVRSFDPCISCATHVLNYGFAPVEVLI